MASLTPSEKAAADAAASVLAAAGIPAYPSSSHYHILCTLARAGSLMTPEHRDALKHAIEFGHFYGAAPPSRFLGAAAPGRIDTRLRILTALWTIGRTKIQQDAPVWSLSEDQTTVLYMGAPRATFYGPYAAHSAVCYLQRQLDDVAARNSP